MDHCSQMRKLESYRELKGKIKEVVNEENTWFYIGYTGKRGKYLWETKPKSQRAKETIKKRNLVKCYTYYTHLLGKTNENAYELIERFRANQNCFNAKAGRKDIEGIVYVVVYTTAVVMPDIAGVRRTSDVRHQREERNNRRSQEPIMGSLHSGTLGREEQWAQRSNGHKKTVGRDEQLVQIHSYTELERKIKQVVNEENKWFYIGYTGKLGKYLWETKPKSQRAKETIKKRNLVKCYTYYTHLLGKKNKNAYELIERFRANQNCFNAKAGRKDIEGIVYVVVYTTAVVMPDIAGVRRTSDVRHQREEGNNRHSQEPIVGSLHSGTLGREEQWAQRSNGHKGTVGRDEQRVRRHSVNRGTYQQR